MLQINVKNDKKIRIFFTLIFIYMLQIKIINRNISFHIMTAKQLGEFNQNVTLYIVIINQ